MKPHVGAIREKLQGLEPWSFGLQPRVLPLYYSFMIKERGLLRIELRVNASKASVFAITLHLTSPYGTAQWLVGWCVGGVGVL